MSILKQNESGAKVTDLCREHGVNSATFYKWYSKYDGMDADFSLPTEKVIRSLERIIDWRGKPASIRCDNDPEYISQKLIDWLIQRRSL